MHINNFDLNTLKALDMLLREKHVSRAANLLNVSQPALSRTLAKLRDQFDDELLVRDGAGHILTTRATDLIEPVRALLSDIEQILRPHEFSFSALEGQICIASLDIEMFLFFPRLLSRVGELAPKLELRAMTISRGDLTILDSGEADFAMIARESATGRYRRRLLYANNHVTLLNKRLSKSIGDTLTLDFFTNADHGLVTVEGTGVGFVDEALAELGLKRNIVARVPNFTLVADICASRDILFTIPEKLASRLANDRRLKVVATPIDTPPASTYLYWHPRNHTNPKNKWFRQLIFETCAVS